MSKIEWVGTTNYRAGRNGKKIIAIVDHITAGLFPGCLSWMQNPKAQASAHYLVTKTGRILQLVKDEDTAWHAGGVNRPNWNLYDGTNPNAYTIGIEHEALAGEGLTEEQFKATAWLHAQLVAKWKIPVDTDHIIGHYRIDSVNRSNCPGSRFPWESLFRVLQKEITTPTTPVPPAPKNAPVRSDIFKFPSGVGWIESVESPDPEKRRVIIHFDEYTYICLWDGKITAHARDKESKQII